MARSRTTAISKMRMHNPSQYDDIDWHLMAEQRFEDFEQLNEQVRGWDLEFHQLKAGRSPVELLQLGRPEFMLTRFYFAQPYVQAGCTAQNTLTIGITEEGVDGVTTPDGAVQQDDILCFPSGRELSAVSQAHFKGYSLSISNTLLEEVAESCGIQIGAKIGKVQQVLHCRRSEMNTIRSELRRVCRSLTQIKTADNNLDIIHEMEFNLIRRLLLVMTDSRPSDRLKLSNRKKIVLQRAQDYMQAHINEPITVLELAQAAGSCVRTLEYVFREYFDVTPKAYLKSRRLVAVRNEMLRSFHLKPAINEIANRWGFWHMSQFARDYCRFFGELPSETVLAK